MNKLSKFFKLHESDLKNRLREYYKDAPEMKSNKINQNFFIDFEYWRMRMAVTYVAIFGIENITFEYVQWLTELGLFKKSDVDAV